MRPLYQKIQSVYKRTERGVIIPGEYSTPEIEFLKDCEWEWTEKVDGTNIRIGWTDGRFWIGGRTENSQTPNSLIEAIESLGLRKELPSIGDPGTTDPGADVVLFGEGYGAKIQKGGGNYRRDQGFVLFDVLINNWWLRRDGVQSVAERLGLDVVPVRAHGRVRDIEGLVEDGITSSWGDFEAEGLVGRPRVPLFNRDGERVMVKLKTVDYRKLARRS